MHHDPQPLGSSGRVSLLALLVLSLALRPQLSAIGPLAPSIMEGLGTGFAYVGLLTAVPVLCMGIFAPVGTTLAHRWGVRAGIPASVAIIVVFAMARVAIPSAPLVLLLTFGVGVGTAVVGPMLTMFVRGRLPGLVVAGTAAYAAGTNSGAAIGAALAVPLAAALGGWRGSLLALAVATVPVIVAWVVLVRRRSRAAAGASAPAGSPAASSAASSATPSRPARARMPVRRPVVWAVGLLFGLQSTLFYGINAWLPSIYIEHGWEPQPAALLLTLSSMVGLLAIFLVPVASHRGASRRQLLLAGAVATAVGLAGILLAPGPAPLWVTLLGMGLSAMFTLVLTLPADVARDAAEAGGAAALVLLVGYLIASAAPFLLGAVRDATGGFVADIVLMILIAVAIMPLAWWLSPERLLPPARVAPAGA